MPPKILWVPRRQIKIDYDRYYCSRFHSLFTKIVEDNTLHRLRARMQAPQDDTFQTNSTPDQNTFHDANSITSDPSNLPEPPLADSNCIPELEISQSETLRRRDAARQGWELSQATVMESALIREMIVCGICSGLKPVKMRSLTCGHRLCLDCLNGITNSQGLKCCPWCREKIGTTSPTWPPDVESKLTAICFAVDFGCDWQGPLRELPEHLYHTTFDGDIKPCAVTTKTECCRWVPTVLEKEHLEVCEQCKEVCSFCHTVLPKSEVPDHMLSECGSVPTQCKYRTNGCLWEGTRAQLVGQHLEECKVGQLVFNCRQNSSTMPHILTGLWVRDLNVEAERERVALVRALRESYLDLREESSELEKDGFRWTWLLHYGSREDPLVRLVEMNSDTFFRPCLPAKVNSHCRLDILYRHPPGQGKELAEEFLDEQPSELRGNTRPKVAAIAITMHNGLDRFFLIPPLEYQCEVKCRLKPRTCSLLSVGISEESSSAAHATWTVYARRSWMQYKRDATLLEQPFIMEVSHRRIAGLTLSVRNNVRDQVVDKLARLFNAEVITTAHVSPPPQPLPLPNSTPQEPPKLTEAYDDSVSASNGPDISTVTSLNASPTHADMTTTNVMTKAVPVPVDLLKLPFGSLSTLCDTSELPFMKLPEPTPFVLKHPAYFTAVAPELIQPNLSGAEKRKSPEQEKKKRGRPRKYPKVSPTQ